jgi:uncharacterized repeat protein (TIGR01451 family)
MNFFPRALKWWLLAAGLFIVSLRADAQGLGLGVTTSTNQVVGTNTVTYILNLTNQTGLLLLNVQVTNTFSASVTLLGTESSQGTNFIDGSSLVFTLGQMPIGASAQMALIIQSAVPGFLTNAIVAAAIGSTNIAATNVVVQIIPTPADLAVALAAPPQAVVVNDLTAYAVAVTNLGPATVTNVVLTNTLPPGVILKSASQPYTLSGSNMIFNLGTLANGGQTAVQIFIQPTNAGTLTFSASVGAPNLLDDNPDNNFASASLQIITYLPATLIAVTNSAQVTNPQNGLTEQSVLISNTGTNDVPAVRLVVTGLTNQLVNAVGTNGINPFVIYGAPLAANKNVSLRLQFFPRGAFPFTNGQLHAFAVPLPDWSPPPVAATSTNVNISRLVQLAGGEMLIEFPATAGRSYTVVYSDNVSFANAQIAPPSVTAFANRLQWIDYGPPATVSAPTNTATRFYRVFQNP